MTTIREAAQRAMEALKATHYAMIDAGLLDQDRLNKNFTAHEALRAALAEPVQEPIKWTLDGDKECGYNNWLGETPFGRILITWKGWKAHPDACVDEFPGGFQAYGEPEEVKAACDAEFARRHGNAPPQRTAEPVQEPVAWRVRGYNQFKTGKPLPWRYFDGAGEPAVNTPDCCDFERLFTAPPQRKPLTEEEILSVLRLAPPEPSLWPHLKDEAVVGDVQKAVLAIARAVERAHKIGGDK